MSSQPKATTPNGWESARLGEVSSINPESLGVGTPGDFRFGYIDLSAVEKGNVEWAEVDEQVFATSPSRARRRVLDGDVLFGTVRPANQSHGFISTKGRDLVASTGFAVIRAISGCTHPRFLFHTVLGTDTFRQARRMEVGSNYPAVNESDVARFELLLPPLPEQRRIAEILDTLDEAIRRTEQVIAKLRQMKQGLLHDLLTRGIDENGELRPPPNEAPELYMESALGWVPRTWAVEQLREFYAEPSRNGLYKPGSYHGRGPLMVQMGNIFKGMDVDFSDAGRVHVSPAELQTYGLKEGDLLFGRRSLVLEGAGKCSLVRALPEPSTFESSIVRARVDVDRLRPNYAALFLGSSASYVQRRRFIRQVAVSGVSGADIAAFPLVCPPSTEQDRIVKMEDVCRRRVFEEITKVAKLRTLKQGLMDDLLTGRVRVQVEGVDP